MQLTAPAHSTGAAADADRWTDARHEVKQRSVILVAVAALISSTAGRSVVRAQVQWQSSTTLNAGDPDRPPGSDNLRAVLLIPLGTSTSVELTSAADGVDFDIDGDGRNERVAWTRPDTQLAFLFFDRDGEGIVKNGTALVGGAMRHDAWNGFMALRFLAPGAGGAITADHPIYSKLLLWLDWNHDGQSQAAELRKVGEVFQKVGLGYFEPQGGQQRDVYGNLVRFQGWLLPTTAPADSLSGYTPAYDVILQVSRGGQRRNE